MSKKITTTVLFPEGKFKNPYLDVEDYINEIYGEENLSDFFLLYNFLSYKYFVNI